MRSLNHALRNSDILLKGKVAGINHNRGVEPGCDAIVAGLLVAVIEVHRKDGLREDLVSGADHILEQLLICVGTGASGNLNDERSLGLDIAAEKPHYLLGIVDIIGANSVFAIGLLKQLFGCDDHALPHL